MGKIITEKIEDKELFLQILNDNIKLFFGTNDEDIVNSVYKLALSRIKSVQIEGWSYSDDDINPREKHGYVEFSTDGKTMIKGYGTRGFNGDIRYLEKLFSQEIWHALMVILNNLYCSNSSVRCSLDNKYYNASNYSGFLKLQNRDEARTSGYMMASSLADILSLAVCKKKNKEDFIIDDLFRENIDDERLASPTADFLTFFQMFVAAFNLKCNNWIEENYKNGRGIADGTTCYKSVCYDNNLFISQSFKQPIMVMREFDKYSFNSTYVEVMSKIDSLYQNYIECGQVDVKGFISVVKEIRNFAFSRLFDYRARGIISEEEYEYLVYNFNTLYQAFRSELSTYRVASFKQKFKKAVKTVVKTRIN